MIEGLGFWDCDLGLMAQGLGYSVKDSRFEI
jgi:hypothetical protein